MDPARRCRGSTLRDPRLSAGGKSGRRLGVPLAGSAFFAGPYGPSVIQKILKVELKLYFILFHCAPGSHCMSLESVGPIEKGPTCPTSNVHSMASFGAIPDEHQRPPPNEMM